jgi:hypothetical protein
MRFMIMIKADKNTEAGVMPDNCLPICVKFNEELVKAGIHAGGRGSPPQFEGRAR